MIAVNKSTSEYCCREKKPTTKTNKQAKKKKPTQKPTDQTQPTQQNLTEKQTTNCQLEIFTKCFLKELKCGI